MFDPFLKLSIMIKISRLKHHLTQQQLADKLGIGLLPYQRLESGEQSYAKNTVAGQRSAEGYRFVESGVTRTDQIINMLYAVFCTCHISGNFWIIRSRNLKRL